MSNVFPQIGNIIKLIRCNDGCTGVQGNVGIVTEKNSNNGHLKTTAGFNVAVKGIESSEVVWRVSGDWILFEECNVRCNNKEEYDHVSSNRGIAIIDNPTSSPVYVSVRKAALTSDNIISYKQYSLYIDQFLSELLCKKVDKKIQYSILPSSYVKDFDSNRLFYVDEEPLQYFTQNNNVYINNSDGICIRKGNEFATIYSLQDVINMANEKFPKGTKFKNFYTAGNYHYLESQGYAKSWLHGNIANGDNGILLKDGIWADKHSVIQTIEAEAKERYPVGSKFIDLVNRVEFTVASHNFDDYGNKKQLYVSVHPVKGFTNKSARIYHDGKWAEYVEVIKAKEYVAGFDPAVFVADSPGYVTNMPIQGVRVLSYMNEFITRDGQRFTDGVDFISQPIECGPGLLSGVKENSKIKVKLIHVKKIE